jgi:uncharacterized protein
MENRLNKILKRAEEIVRANLANYDSGHDWWHIERVRRLARRINEVEKTADPFILDIVVLFHDYADSKFNGKDNAASYQNIERYLEEFGIDEHKRRIISAIKNSSFSNKNPVGDLEDPLLTILQDADRLDAIGAIGVARAFNYGGFRNNPIYDPAKPINDKSTIAHFYDKLLILKDGLHSEIARNIADERHKFLEIFLDQFYKEWDV